MLESNFMCWITEWWIMIQAALLSLSEASDGGWCDLTDWPHVVGTGWNIGTALCWLVPGAEPHQLNLWLRHAGTRHTSLTRTDLWLLVSEFITGLFFKNDLYGIFFFYVFDCFWFNFTVWACPCISSIVYKRNNAKKNINFIIKGLVRPKNKNSVSLMCSKRST